MEALARAKAPVAKDAGLSDTQARALLAMLAPHDRAKLEDIVQAEANGQLATHADVERRTVAAVLDAAFASAEVAAVQAEDVRRQVCALRGATAKAARQLARGELLAADYVALISAVRAEAEAALGKALGGPRFDKLRAAGALDGPPCDRVD